MKERRSRSNRRALGPVFTAIILVSVVVAVVTGITSWLRALTSQQHKNST